MPGADAAEEARKLSLDPALAGANSEERRNLPLSLPDAVYVDAKQTRQT